MATFGVASTINQAGCTLATFGPSRYIYWVERRARWGAQTFFFGMSLGLAATCATRSPASQAGPTTLAKSSPVLSASVIPDAAAADADADADNIIGIADQCPDEAEVYNGWGDEDGCPDRSHSHDRVAPHSEGRGVSGPERPENCPIFRRILSTSGQLQSWTLTFGHQGPSSDPFFTSEVDRVVEALLRIPGKVELYFEAGEEEDESPSLAAQRLGFTRQLLISRGVPAAQLTIASEKSTHAKRIRFRVFDKSLIHTEYTCYPGP